MIPTLDHFAEGVLGAVEEQVTLEKRLQSVVEVYVKHFKENHDLFRIINREVTGSGKYLNFITDRYFSKLHSAISSVIAQGSREGIFKGVDPHMAALSVIGIILFYFADRQVIDRLAGEEAQVEKMIDSLKSHILALLAKG